MDATDAPKFSPIQFVGSFQRGSLLRTGDPLSSVWRQIARVGTIESIERISRYKSVPATHARTASLRIKQAIELREASRTTGVLTRPLLLYYSALNLMRGILIALTGKIGVPGHGLKFSTGQTVFSCGASVNKGGTFPEMLQTFSQPITDPSRIMSLRDALSLVPELAGDFHLLESGQSTVVPVEVKAYTTGNTLLAYFLPGHTVDDFNANWQDMFPWWKTRCTLADKPFTLAVIEKLATPNDVSKLCEGTLLPDLNWRDNAIWMDHIVRPNGPSHIAPITAYLFALFILSNVTRYEPELLDNVMRDPSDKAYVVDTFLNHAERYLPQLALHYLYSPRSWFV